MIALAVVSFEVDHRRRPQGLLEALRQTWAQGQQGLERTFCFDALLFSFSVPIVPSQS